MSSTTSTSGYHGINGDLNVTGTVTASTISGNHVIVNGSDITSALTLIGETESTVADIMSGAKFVGLAGAVKTNSLVSDNNHYSLLCGPSDGSNVRPYGSDSLIFTQTPQAGNDRGNLEVKTSMVTLNTLATDTTDIKGRLTVDGTTHFKEITTFDASVRANGGISITNNGINVTNGGLSTTNGGVSITNGDINITNGSITVTDGITVYGTSNITGLKTHGNITMDNYLIFKPDATPNPITLGYSNLISVSSTSASIIGTGGVFYQTNVLALTVDTNPDITIPDASLYLLGQEIRFFRDPLQSSANAACKLKVSNNCGGFIVSNTPGTNTFQLGNSGTGWFKAFFQCIMLSDSKYYWVQTYYQ